PTRPRSWQTSHIDSGAASAPGMMLLVHQRQNAPDRDRVVLRRERKPLRIVRAVVVDVGERATAETDRGLRGGVAVDEKEPELLRGRPAARWSKREHQPRFLGEPCPGVVADQQYGAAVVVLAEISEHGGI